MSRRSTRRAAAQQRSDRFTRSHFSTRRQLHRQLRLEPLEDRHLLAITVTTLADTVDFNDGVTSLREAIFAANTVPGADTIDFAPALTVNGPATILLTHGELKITDSLTINGPGADLLTIDASGNDPTPEMNNGDGSRVFNLDDESEFHRIGVTLAGLTITGGDSAVDGGGIRSVEDFRLIGAVVSNNASRGQGGGVSLEGRHYFDRIAVEIVDSQLSGNTAFQLLANAGGGVFGKYANIAITGSVLQDNLAAVGGGAGLQSASLTMLASIVRQNTAREFGGGIDLDSSAATIQQSSIVENESLQQSGGGIGARTSTLKVLESLIAHNKAARYGGGIADIGSFRTELVNTTLAGNAAGHSGGGALLFTNQVSITNSTISGNTATVDAGGIGFWYVSAIQISESTIIGNRADVDNDGNGSGGGVALYLQNHVRLIGSIIAGNSSGSVNVDDVSTNNRSTVVASNSLIGSNLGSTLAEAPVELPDGDGNLIGGPVHGIIDPRLGPLADNGGFELPDGSRILTHALLSGSPAINAGNLNAVAGQGGVPQFDQRGEPFGRIVGGRIDIGAFEYQTPTDLNLLVDTLVDESDGDYSRGDLSLREAIELANKYRYVGVVDTIRFDPALTANGPATILLTQGELKITDSLTINGPGADLLTIDASGSDPTPHSTLGDGIAEDDFDGSRVLNIDDGNVDALARITVRIDGMTLTGADAPGLGLRDGGAVRNREQLMLTSTVIQKNTAAYGGGIWNDGLLTLTDCSILQNESVSGGGIFSYLPGSLTIDRCIISENTAFQSEGRSCWGGGIYSGNAALAVTRSQISGNAASYGGGMMVLGGVATVRESAIDGNVAEYGGGGVLTFSGAATTIASSAIANNIAERGGGVSSYGPLILLGSTISGNAASSGGGLDLGSDGATVRFSTITNNSSPDGQGSGVALRGISLVRAQFQSSIISGNTNSDIDFVGQGRNYTRSNGFNLIGTGTGTAAFSAHGDLQTAANTWLGPLTDNGGFELPDGSRILTHALLPGSPAINAGDLNAVAGEGGVPQFDQRGEPFGRIVGGRIDIGAFESPTPTDLNLLVDTLVDESDGDYSRGDLSLREAIELANKYRYAGVVDTIRFDPALTANGPATILLTQGELKITDSLTINGPGANLLTIDASGNDPTPDSDPFDNINDDYDGTRIFLVSDGIADSQIGVHIARMTLTGGEASGEFYQGGGILSFEDLTLDSIRVVGNVAGEGGGVAALDGCLQIMDCEFVGNSAFFDSGGGLFVSNAQLSIEGSSFRENMVFYAGGAIRILNTGSQVAVIEATDVTGNIVRLNGGRGGGIVALVSSDGGRFELIASNVSNNELRNVGGSSQLDAGGGGIHLTVGNGAMGTIRDSRVNENYLAPPESGRLESDGGGLWARAFGGTISVIDSQFDQNSASRYGGALSASGVFGGNVRIEKSVISRNSAASGGGVSIVGSVLVADSLIQTNMADTGGGIWVGGGQFNTTARVVRSEVEENSARLGGGVYLTGPTPLEIQSSTLSQNRGDTGGGIWANGSLLVRQSTISGNTASVGGGLFLNSPNPATISHSTVAFNQATGVGNGLHLQSNLLELNHSILASNTGAVLGDATVVAGASLASKFSLIGRGQGSGITPTSGTTPDANGNLIGSGANGINPGLGPLAENGGITKTHVLLSASPAISFGDPAAVAGQGGVPLHDQRGVPFTRVFGGRIDIGAVESIPIGFLSGDYSVDGVVDARDYTVWRDSLGAIVLPGSGADGNGDGVVDQLDYDVWKSNFGATAHVQGAGSAEQGVAWGASALIWQSDEEPSAELAAIGLPRQPVLPLTNVLQPPALPGVRRRGTDQAEWNQTGSRDRVLEAWLSWRRFTDDDDDLPTNLASDAGSNEVAVVDAAFDQMDAASKHPRQSRGLQAVRML